MKLRVAPFTLLKRSALCLLLITAVFWGGEIALLSVLPVPFSAMILERQVSAWPSEDVHYLAHSDWVSIDEISPWIGLAVIAIEDQKLPEHWRFDISAIEKALAHNERHNTRIRGASTLSQQMTKNLFLWGDRSWLYKGLEARLTVGIGTVWNKKRILTVYLNIIRSGDGIFGVEIATQRYFHKPTSQPAPGETALLATALPNPIRYRADAPSGYVHGRQAWILRQVQQLSGEGFIRGHKLY